MEMIKLRNRETVLALLDNGLKRCKSNHDLSLEYLNGAQEALEAAKVLSNTHPKIAFEQCHESIRKAMTAFLNEQGLRPGFEGSHHATVIDAISAQLGHVLGGLVKEVRSIKTRRNMFQYPQQVMEIETDEVRNAISVAESILNGLSGLVQAGRVPMFS